MANYEKFEETKDQLTTQLASNSNISEEQKVAVVEAVTSISTVVQAAIDNSIQSNATENPAPATVEVIENVTAENLQNVNVAVVTGGANEQSINIDLSNATPENTQQLAAIVVASDKPVEITIENENFGGSVVLGSGQANVVIDTPKPVTIETGSGDANVQTGAGNDTVVVNGNATINSGEGNDTIVIPQTFSGNAVITSNGGSDNTLKVDSVREITSQQTGSVTNSSSRQIDSNGNATTVNTSSSANVTAETLLINTQLGGTIGATNFNTLVLDDTPVLVTLADSVTPVNITTGRGDDKISLGRMDDELILTGGDDTVSTGAGDDRVEIKSDFSGDATVKGGVGQNELVLDKATVVMENNGSLSIELSTGSVAASQFKTVVLGDNGSSINTQTTSLNVISKASLNVVTGKGNDSVALGIGHDSVTISGGNDSVNTGAGRDTVKIASNFTGNATVNGGTGRDTLELTDVNANSVALNGDQLVVTLGNNATVNVSSFEAIVLSSDSAANVNLADVKSALHLALGEGDDSVVLGAGRDTVVLTSGNDTVNTGAGNDRLKIAASFNGDAVIDGDSGNFDILDLSAVGILSVDKTETVVTITLENSSTLDVTNVEYFVYSTNDESDDISFTGVTTFVDSF